MKEVADLGGEALAMYRLLNDGVQNVVNSWDKFTVELVIFRGSVARNESLSYSDLDCLVVIPDNDIDAVNQYNFQQFVDGIELTCPRLPRRLHVVCVRESWFNTINIIPSGTGLLSRAVRDAQTNGVVLWQYPG